MFCIISCIILLIIFGILLYKKYIIIPFLSKLYNFDKKVIARTDVDTRLIIEFVLKYIMYIEKISFRDVVPNMSAEQYLHNRNLIRNAIKNTETLIEEDKNIILKYVDELDDMSINKGKMLIYKVIKNIGN